GSRSPAENEAPGRRPRRANEPAREERGASRHRGGERDVPPPRALDVGARAPGAGPPAPGAQAPAKRCAQFRARATRTCQEERQGTIGGQIESGEDRRRNQDEEPREEGTDGHQGVATPPVVVGGFVSQETARACATITRRSRLQPGPVGATSRA